jgi:lysophospholipase L1-like esterase
MRFVNNESTKNLIKILCYGDSNTWGYNPKDSSRFDESKRWTGILKKILAML